MTIVETQAVPAVMTRSRAKIRIRTGLLEVFGTLSGSMLDKDITNGAFTWTLGLVIFLACRSDSGCALWCLCRSTPQQNM